MILGLLFDNIAKLWDHGGVSVCMLLIVCVWAVSLFFFELMAMFFIKERAPSQLPILAALAGIAPLLGLLGTVIGLVSIFTLEHDPEQMAAGISQALVSTKLGLIIAIPLLIGRQVLLRWREVRFARGYAPL